MIPRAILPEAEALGTMSQHWSKIMERGVSLVACPPGEARKVFTEILQADTEAFGLNMLAVLRVRPIPDHSRCDQSDGAIQGDGPLLASALPFRQVQICRQGLYPELGGIRACDAIPWPILLDSKKLGAFASLDYFLAKNEAGVKLRYQHPHARAEAMLNGPLAIACLPALHRRCKHELQSLRFRNVEAALSVRFTSAGRRHWRTGLALAAAWNVETGRLGGGGALRLQLQQIVHHSLSRSPEAMHLQHA